MEAGKSPGCSQGGKNMRIQHNIAAMNSYRNLGVNNTALGKNLEKLSSGYKINRAGDDAAGLAISEKMRAQITGLQKAQDNANDGIALVQTAEGALTEVHSMLNRMTELANQSANGTYQDEIDRENLQKEVASLQSEIDRISKSTNFNGINLLDGSLAGGSGVANGDAALKVLGNSNVVGDGGKVQQQSEVTLAVDANATVMAGDKMNVTIEFTDGTKKELTFSSADGKKGINYNGNTLTAAFTADGKPDATGLAAAVAEVLGKDSAFTEKYAISANAGKLTLTSNNAAFGEPSIKSVSTNVNGTYVTNASGNIVANKEGKGAYNTIDASKMTVYDASSNTKNKDVSVITVDGQKFAFAKDQASAKELGADVNAIIVTGTNGTFATGDDTSSLIDLMNQKLGTNIVAPAAGDKIDMITKGGFASGTGKGLTLQIGDTADNFNKLTVSVGDMSSSSLGIGSVDISTQDGASAAIEKIKNAINSVSSTRGDLGAIQNRLEHTINNLGVTEENMTSAESRIRDTDMAAEMMEYTKNNILIQASQAMLAQANQLPQGVLQLLG